MDEIGRHPTLLTRKAFSLVELLVVIGIICLLVAALLPALNRARSQARCIQCQSNIQQICMGLTEYASENRGFYPANKRSGLGAFWCDAVTLGRYVPLKYNLLGYDHAGGYSGGGVYVCPEDENSLRSYSMNIWASCQVTDNITTPPITGTLWRSSTRGSSRLILLAESWSQFKLTGVGNFADPLIGLSGDTAAQRFGALGGIPPFYTNTWGVLNCELPYIRHRQTASTAMGPVPKGRVAIGFADCHVQLLADTDLFNPNTGQITGTAIWSPFDVQ